MCGFHGNGTEHSLQFFKPAVHIISLSWLGRDKTLKVCGNQAKLAGCTSYPALKRPKKNSRELWARQGMARAEGVEKKRHPNWHTTCKSLYSWHIYREERQMMEAEEAPIRKGGDTETKEKINFLTQFEVLESRHSLLLDTFRGYLL